MGNKVSKTDLLKIQGELNLPHPLRSYQWEGVSFLINNTSCLLSDEMGLGKTVQVAVALEILYRQNQLGRVLIIVPSSLKLNWQNELLRWTNSPSIQRVQGNSRDRQAYYRLPISVLIASYDEIRIDVLEFINDVIFDVVIIDEAQRIKNSSSNTSLSCKIINRHKSWALTGTPVENKLNDLISIYNFVNTGLIHKALSRKELQDRIQPHFLRRKKNDVAKELPPIIEQEIPIILEGHQREAYDNVLYEKQSQIQSYSYGDLLAIITKLKQICNYDSTSGQSSKFNILEGIVEEHFYSGEKVIVFSQYVDTLKWVSNKIQHVPHDIYSGELKQDEREKVLNNFRKEDEPRVLLMSLKAGGVGLNIQEAHTVVLFDRWWNPAVENQAIQRAHRLGREIPLHVVKFLVINSIEEKISEIITNKRVLFDKYIETASNADISSFSSETLQSIIGISSHSINQEI